MAGRTGVSAEALSELGFAAEQSGADLETLETGLRKMQKLIGDAADGSASAGDALGKLGLTLANLQGMAPEQQFKLIADRLSKIEDPTLRAAAAMEIFGKSGTRLLPLVQDGAKGIEDLQQQARALGLTVSTETAKDAALLNDTLNILWRVLKQGVFVVGSALAPTVVELSNAVTRAVVSVTNWIRQNKAVVVTAAKVAAVVAAAGVAI
ncbi:MAG TPA: phage tail tape measure protein, partial [Phycisphaerae bacterium]|nr:phage tail tape measure protein [Phycisphaerae bacterium]